MQIENAMNGEISSRIALEVRVTDLNYGNHLSNDAILGYFHQGRVALLAGLGLSEQDIGGAGLIMRRCQLDFLAEGFLFDRLQLETGMGMHGRAQCRFGYRLMKGDDETELARGITDMAFFDYSRHQLVRPPANLVKTLGSFKQD